MCVDSRGLPLHGTVLWPRIGLLFEPGCSLKHISFGEMVCVCVMRVVGMSDETHKEAHADLVQGRRALSWLSLSDLHK